MDTQTGNYITGDTAFAVDRRGAIVLWNKAAEKTLGYSSSDALGQKCWKLLSGEDTYGNRYCCRHCPVRDMAFDHEPVHNFQFTCKSNSNEDKHFSVSCLTVSNNQGNEMLLHMCRQEEQSTRTDNGSTTTRTPISKHPDTLSHREIEVLTLLADKISTRDIAATLSISIRTVRTHIQHLMYKLQVHKRCEAVEAGKHLKLI